MFPDIFFIVFSIAFLTQIIFFYLYNTIVENIFKKKAFEKIIELQKEKEKNIHELICPCGENNVQQVPINVNNEVVYTCNKCKRDIKTNTTINTALVTTPLYLKEENELSRKNKRNTTN